ncbi:iron-sulfur cluster assembly scaffold protein [bacterium]|nr:iron-sulfur cluster assembly scaffold protein [bacterium]
MSDSNDKLEEAMRNPQNLGEMDGADAVGTVGSPDCGDMLRMWVKFREEDGKQVIDKATFQSFGCQTAIAVASVATEMIKGKTVKEALAMDSKTLSEPLGPLPPMKIHCGQLVESALKDALSEDMAPVAATESQGPMAPSLIDAIPQSSPSKGKVKIVPIED